MALVDVERRATSWWVFLNRPDRKNTFNAEMASELSEALNAARHSREARVVVLAGRGPTFGMGAELDWIESAPETRLQLMEFANAASEAIFQMRQPTVAVVKGVAAGGACNLALSCDFVIAADDATFIQPFGRVGLSVDSGGSWLLPRLVGYRKAIEWAVLGGRLSSQEAVELGLINKAIAFDEVDQAATELVDQLATLPQDATALTKRLIQSSFSASALGSLGNEAIAQAFNLASSEFGAALAGMKARRSAT